MEKFNDFITPNLNCLRNSLRTHYGQLWQLINERNPIEEKLDEYDREHPGLNAYQLKAAQYQILAENMETVVFDDSPFFYVNDLCRGPQAGAPFYTAGGWLLRRNKHLCREISPEAYVRYEGMKRCRLFVGNELMYFDDVHFCFPITNVVKHGLKYYYDKAEAALSGAKTQEEQDFLLSAMAGFQAAKRIAERFGQVARERLRQVTDPQQQKFMRMIADAAERVPWEGSKHFYEGLNTMWFCRNVLGEIEGIGNSHLGRPDLILYDMYVEDLNSGYMTREEAYDLVSRFLVHGDCEYDKDSTVLHQNDHELEMGYVLGGCDSDGNAIYNEVTTMFIQAHRAQNCIYPKVHYRFGKNSCDDYLNDISYDYVHGRSVAGLTNDDSVILFLVNCGLSLEDARGYVNYGCWGIAVECKTNSAGGSFVHMLSVMEHTIYGDNEDCILSGLHFNPIDDAKSFEEVYDIFYDNLIRALRERVKLLCGKHPALPAQVHPIPIFTALMDGWIDKKRDYPRSIGYGFNLAELANVIDGLLAIKDICFDKKIISLPEYLDAVRSNWEDYEYLRLSLRKCPHYGDESSESKELTKRLIEGVSKDAIGDGRRCGISLLIYQELLHDSKKMRATPDGRRDGDIVAQGVNPTRIHDDSVLAVLNSASVIDPITVATHSMNLQLPAAKMTVERMSAIIKATQKLSMKHIQINCVDAETLRDAQKHPERHQDLVVRVVGFSAKFVSLSPQWQDEFINRVIYNE